MNHHDIGLIEIGQKEGYAKAVREIVARLREEATALDPAWPENWTEIDLIEGWAIKIEAEFLEQKKNTFLQRPS